MNKELRELFDEDLLEQVTAGEGLNDVLKEYSNWTMNTGHTKAEGVAFFRELIEKNAGRFTDQEMGQAMMMLQIMEEHL